MENFNSLKLRARIFLGYLVPLVLFGGLGVMIYVNDISRDRQQTKIDRANMVIERVNLLAYGMSGIVRNARGQVLFPSEDGYQKAYEKSLAQYRTAAKGFIDLADNQELKTLMLRAVTLAESNIAYAEDVFKLLEANEVSKAIEPLKEIRLEGAVEEVLEEILADRKATLEQLTLEREAADDVLATTVIAGFVVSLLSSIVFGLLVTNWISRRLLQSANEITTSSNQIATTIQQQEQIANQQAAAVNETTATMDELEASCRQSVEQAQTAVGAAQEALRLAESGTKAVGQTLEGMFTMEKRVEAIADQIVYLSEQASQIANISQLVSELANQTNMLALNSSVEAVRAGEHGKGFAIVANEIRKLSDQSESSAEKISVLVSEIQKAINATVMVTDEGTKTVKSSVQIAQQMEKTFAGVAETVNKVALNNQQVSLNLKQQVDAMRQVVDAMETINQGAKETAAGLSETKTGTQHLNQAALLLREMV
jgi:methyl-accepting chemotaxis protein